MELTMNILCLILLVIYVAFGVTGFYILVRDDRRSEKDRKERRLIEANRTKDMF